MVINSASGELRTGYIRCAWERIGGAARWK